MPMIEVTTSEKINKEIADKIIEIVNNEQRTNYREK